MTKAKIEAVSEIAFWVSDVETATKWYCENFDLHVEDAQQGKHAFLKTGELLIVLFNRNDPGTLLGAEYLARTGGPKGDLYHVAFKIEGTMLDDVAESMRARGCELRGPMCFASGRRSYFLEDLDDHTLELTDR